ncbi:hypothetical protein GCM10009118_13400 [Wandonia haliotis]|uniref:Uncharacterized protein n=1 Tax=Wandonia haliotis TaxID=574963 RepID=A0ABN1MQ06_9FLAO
MKRIQYIAIYGVLIIGLMGCKKEVADPDSFNPNVLPPLTHEGKNTFGCKVNGEVWGIGAPYTISGPVALDGSYTLSTGRFYLKGTLKTDGGDIFENVRIRANEVYSVGEYNMGISSDQVTGFSDYSENHNCGSYYNIQESPGKIFITYFSISEGIISGVFEMDLVNPSCPGDTIRIREGRFDWRMIVY